MKTTILVITIICIVAIIGLILTNSNQDKNGQTEPITLDSSTKQRSNSKQAENLSTPPKNISPTLSDKDKTLLNTPAETENLQLQYELKNKPSSEGIKPFVGNNNDNDPVNELEQAFYQNDQQAIKTAIDIAAHCSECLPRLKEILENEGADNQLRFYAAQALIKSGGSEAAKIVLKEIVNANLLERDDLEDGLKQAFVQLDSVEAANTLIAILLNEQALDLDTPMPDGIDYMVSKVIRKMSDRKAIADTLTQQYHNTSTPKEKERLLTIGHPETNALLVVDSHKKNDVEQANNLYARLMKLDDQAVIDGMMLIAKNKDIFPLEDIAGSAYEWVNKHKNESTLSTLVNYLSDFDSTSEERVIAVYGIAAAKEDDKTIAALMKAWEHSEEPIVRDHLKALATMPHLFSSHSK